MRIQREHNVVVGCEHMVWSGRAWEVTSGVQWRATVYCRASHNSTCHQAPAVAHQACDTAACGSTSTGGANPFSGRQRLSCTHLSRCSFASASATADRIATNAALRAGKALGSSVAAPLRLPPSPLALAPAPAPAPAPLAMAWLLRCGLATRAALQMPMVRGKIATGNCCHK